jgi:hypothetical protein
MPDQGSFAWLIEHSASSYRRPMKPQPQKSFFFRLHLSLI